MTAAHDLAVGEVTPGGITSKADLAYQTILHGIQQGRFAPGSRLVLSQLAEELEMSCLLYTSPSPRDRG